MPVISFQNTLLKIRALLLLIGLIGLLAAPLPALAQRTRAAVWAGKFYPANTSDLQHMIADLTRQAQKTGFMPPPQKKLKALILPHAGYIYSGLTAAHASLVLKPRQYKKIILVAPDHRIGFRNGVISDVDYYETPLGKLKLHPDASGLRLQSHLFQTSPASDREEHSLEVILPFLQTYLQDFELVPIVLGPAYIPSIAQALDNVRDKDTLLVVSSDLSHYLAYDKAVAQDQETIDLILNLKSQQLIQRKNTACGRFPILMVMEMARRHSWQPVKLHYSNSGDTAGDRQRVVGYTTIAFYGKSEDDRAGLDTSELTRSEGQILVRLARQTLINHFFPETPLHEITASDLQNNCFQQFNGTFVTIKKNGRLRGCIGNIMPQQSIPEGIRQNTIQAAIHDSRFPPLRAEELDQVHISISILSQPQALPYINGQDLLAKLRPHVDGVILRKGNAGATFLPQVWEQLPDKSAFLSALCRKAGLPPSAWQETPLEVFTYQAQYFDEKN